MRMPDPNDPRLWWAGCALVLAVAVVIAWGHWRPMPAPRLGLYQVDPEGVTVHVPPEAPCTLERVQLACDRWAAHGWPRCVAQPTGGEVALVVFAGDAAGAAADGVVGVAPDQCGRATAALEHELGHALYDLAHVAVTGGVMCYDAGCAGLTFPVAP